MSHYNRVLELLGPSGTYQKRLTLLYAIPAVYQGLLVFYTLAYTVFVPSHSCNQTSQIRQCSNGTAECGEKVVYDYGDIGKTMASEWDLVCGNDVQLSLIITSSQVGELVGAVGFSYIMDKIGRRLSVLTLSMWLLVTGVAIFFTSSLTAVIIIVFLRGIPLRMVFHLPWVLTSEFVGVKQRSKLYICQSLAAALGLCSLSLFSWWIMEWRYVILLTTLPSLMAIPQMWLILESPRWLITQGKHSEAIATLQTVARVNKKGGALLEEFKMVVEKGDEDNLSTNQNHGVWSLFTHGKSLALKAVIMALLYVVLMLVNVGLNYNIENFGTNPYIAGACVAIVEIPACLCTALADKCGRTRITSLFLFAAGVFALSGVILTTYSIVWASVLMAVCTKFSIAVAYNCFTILLAETFPTVVRATGVGFCCFASQLGCFAIPYIVLSARAYQMVLLPMTVFSTMAFIGCFLVLLVPETGNMEMPDTFEEERKIPAGLKNVRMNLFGGKRMFLQRELENPSDKNKQ